MAKTITLPKRVVDFSLSGNENAHLTNAEAAIARVLAHVAEIPTAVRQHAKRSELGIRLRAIVDQITEAIG